jgi:DNA-binding IclR family transcriptional regulator
MACGPTASWRWSMSAGNPSPSDYFLNQPWYSRSLAMGVAVTGCFRGEQVLGVSDMAEMLGVSKSTTHRYAVTLVALGWLEQTQGRKYRLGPRSAWPGMAVLGEIAVLSQCEPVLRDLRRHTGYTASLGVLDGTRVTYVRRFPSHREGQYEADGELRAGAHVPLYCTASGVALLANLHDEELRDVLARLELTRHTKRTVTSKRRLQAKIVQTKSDGMAVSDREFIGSERSVAAAVSERAGEWRLAVELNAPAASSSVEMLLGSVGRLVREAASRIGAKLAPSVLSPVCAQDAAK